MGNRKERRQKKQPQSEKVTKAGYSEKYQGVLGFFDVNYKKLMIIPALLLLFALGQIAYQYATTGDFMNKGVSLKGGLTLTFPYDGNSGQLEEQLKSEYPGEDINVRSLASAEGLGVVVEAGIIEGREEFSAGVSRIADVPTEDMNIDVMGSSLGASFFRQVFTAMIISFILMAIVVFIYFRDFIPSMAVILAAATDIIITLAIVNVLGIRVSTAGIAAFLMLIGYSIDTDILLNTRTLKSKEGSVFSRMVGAAKTGLTMSISTLAAITVGMLLSQSEVLSQIMTIMFIGLLVDIINTWIQNVGILRYYLEKKGIE